MAYALVQSKAKDATVGANGSITLDAAPTQYNLIVVVLTVQLLASAVTQPTGFTRDTFKVSAASNNHVQISSKIAGAGESATIAYTFTSAAYEIEAYEFSGNYTAAAVLDLIAPTSAPGSTNSLSPGSTTPNAANELFVVAAGCMNSNGGGETIGGGFTAVAIASHTRLLTGYKIKTDAAAENPTCAWTTASQAEAVMAVYKLPVSATLTPGAIAGGEGFGTTMLARSVSPGGIATAQAIGTAALARSMSPSAIASGEAQGTPALQRTMSPSAIASAGAIGSASLARTMSPSGIATAFASGTAMIARAIAMAGIATGQALGTPSMSRSMSPTGIATGGAVGTPALSRTVSPSGIASAAAFGVAMVARAIAIAGIASAEAVGTPIVIGPQYITPVGIASVEVHGTAMLALKMFVNDTLTGEAFGVVVLVQPFTLLAFAVRSPTSGETDEALPSGTLVYSGVASSTFESGSSQTSSDLESDDVATGEMTVPTSSGTLVGS